MSENRTKERRFRYRVTHSRLAGRGRWRVKPRARVHPTLHARDSSGAIECQSRSPRENGYARSDSLIVAKPRRSLLCVCIAITRSRGLSALKAREREREVLPGGARAICPIVPYRAARGQISQRATDDNDSPGSHPIGSTRCVHTDISPPGIHTHFSRAPVSRAVTVRQNS